MRKTIRGVNLLRPLGYVAVAGMLAGQTLPLESIEVEGPTKITKEAVIRFSGLRIGEATDKGKIDAACQTLQESQLFEQVSYRYRPGPKHGYAVTLTLSDLGRLMDAAIDIVGINEAEYWDWMRTISPAFDRKVAGPAQDFLAKQIEQHAGAAMNGQHLVARIEADVSTGRNLVAFQPEKLPSVASIGFSGQKEFNASELSAYLKNAMADGYTDRTFNKYVDINLRPQYENHGMYRVRFLPVTSRRESDSSVAVSVSIEEGGKYNLGDVELVGDNLPQAEMMKSAKLPLGRLANWTTIQNGMYLMEKELKRAGYYEAYGKPERKPDDAAHALNIRIVFHTGPIYQFSETVYKGLNPMLEAKAKSLWKHPAGDTWDMTYATEFAGEFKRDAATRNLRVTLEERASKDAHTVTEVLTFQEP